MLLKELCVPVLSVMFLSCGNDSCYVTAGEWKKDSPKEKLSAFKEIQAEIENNASVFWKKPQDSVWVYIDGDGHDISEERFPKLSHWLNRYGGSIIYCHDTVSVHYMHCEEAEQGYVYDGYLHYNPSGRPHVVSNPRYKTPDTIYLEKDWYYILEESPFF